MRETQHTRIDPSEFRNTLGKFASGITVVTTAHEGSVHGMTANAFVSVSLEPPLVLVSVDNRSRTRKILSQSGSFGVSILSGDQRDLSQHFAGRPKEGLEIPFVWQSGIPLLEGAVGRLVCKVADVHPAGDHTLYIGEVEYLDHEDGMPLIFYTGRYANLQTDSMKDSDVDWWIGYNIYGQSGLGA